jgi:hypothetical protein
MVNPGRKDLLEPLDRLVPLAKQALQGLKALVERLDRQVRLAQLVRLAPMA